MTATMIDIVDRIAWDAAPPRWAYYPINQYQPRLILHHSAGAEGIDDDIVSLNDLRRIQGIQWYHQVRKGWNDIAYNWLFDYDGYLFEGRGPGVANGATKGFGTTSYAICVMGHFDIQKVDETLTERLAAVVVWGHLHGWWPLAITGGHRDFGSTSCPGGNLYPLISSINQRAKEIHMATFKDVPRDHTHYNAIEWLAQQGITHGTNPPKNDLFSPDRGVTRAEFATLLKRYHDKTERH